MKKLLALLLALSMVFALASCGSGNNSSQSEPPAEETAAATSAPEETEETAAPAEPEETQAPETSGEFGSYTIGINNWVAGVYGLDALVYQAAQIFEATGSTVEIANNGAELDKIISDLENMVNSGVDGVMWFGLLETNFAVGPQICEDAKVPFALYDKLPAEGGENEAAILEMEYFAGAVGTDDYTIGHNMGMYAIENGDSSFILCGTEVGDPTSDGKLEGFEAAVTENGGTVVDIGHIESDAALTVTDLVSAHPDVDAVYCTGDSGTIATVSVLQSLGNDMHIYGSDLGTSTIEYLRDGSVTASNGGQYVESAFAAVLLENYLDGTPLRDEDGHALMLRSIISPIVPAQEVDLYEKVMINQYPLTADYLSDLFVVNNPDVTADDFIAAVEDFSFYDMVKYYYDQGVVTDEDLSAAGLTYDELG